MRIVGGKHKGRPLSAPKGKSTRPTSDRARESVFNVLAHGIDGFNLADANMADIFAGTGALGLEALSRGGGFCTFIESDRDATAILKQNIAALGESKNTKVITLPAQKAPPPPDGAVDIAFLDAPYAKDLSVSALEKLASTGWFKTGSVVVIEISKDEKIELPAEFEIIKEKVSGPALHIFTRYMV